MNIDHFTFYRSYFEAIQDLKSKDQLLLFNAICNKALNNKCPKLTGITKTLFTLIMPNVDSNRDNIINGQKGGRPKKKPPLITPLNNPPLEKTESNKEEEEEEEVDKEEDKEVKEDIKPKHLTVKQIDEIYEMYPVKKGKSVGYKKLRKESSELYELILDKVKQYTGTTEPKYYKHFSSWVNQKGWQDEYANKVIEFN